MTSNGHEALAQQVVEKKVVIIGSGLSGFSAAAKFLENDWDDIVVLEAENRTGGRTYSVPFRQGYIDMGK